MNILPWTTGIINQPDTILTATWEHPATRTAQVLASPYLAPHDVENMEAEEVINALGMILEAQSRNDTGSLKQYLEEFSGILATFWDRREQILSCCERDQASVDLYIGNRHIETGDVLVMLWICKLCRWIGKATHTNLPDKRKQLQPFIEAGLSVIRDKEKYPDMASILSLCKIQQPAL